MCSLYQKERKPMMKKNKRLPNFYRLTRLAGAKEISEIKC